MRILVTGGIGVNGAVVVRKLIERGMTPIAADARLDFSLVADIRDRFEFTVLDVTDLANVRDCLEAHGVQRIIHLAAFIDPDMDRQPYRSFTVNALGTANVLEAARLAGIKRVVYSSSRAVYGQTPEGVGEPGYTPIDEEFPKRPLLSYDVTKLAAEQLGQVYRSVYGMEFAALRFSAIYGPGKQARHGRMSLRSRLVEDPFNGIPVRVAKGGDQVDDLVYVDDAAEGIVMAALVDTLPHAAYNIASGTGCTLHQFADAVRHAIPGADIELGPGLNPLGFSVNRAAIFDIARARHDLGFNPRFDLVSGVTDYVKRLMRMRAGN